MASLDVLSGGRFMLGVGAGYLEPELTAAGLGVDTDEYLDAMASLWHDEAPAFHGRHISFAQVDAYPRPANVRVVVGGHSRGGVPLGGVPAGGLPIVDETRLRPQWNFAR
ncbi:LLM class flavin-dependent oxidoreductase [Actinophytocola sp.]|uniref:LLM class flavin-dependent oxidoreductase n=1 Tax=Actinophytocola sp. TaxID=1872138 RepID=UPI00389982EE